MLDGAQEGRAALTPAKARRLLEHHLRDALRRLGVTDDPVFSAQPGSDDAELSEQQHQRDLSLGNRERLTEIVHQCRDALQRIEEGIYGVCVTCGKKIPEPRLAVYPEASECIRCRERTERLHEPDGAPERVVRVPRPGAEQS